MRRIRLTREQRHEVSKAALEFYIISDFVYMPIGLCYAIKHCKCDAWRPSMYIYPTQYPEIFKHAPKFSERDIWWWPIHDREIRISVLKQAIEETKPM